MITLQTKIKEKNRFFKQPTWYKQNPLYDIDEIYDELMEGEVKEIIEIEKDHVLDSINSPIVNVETTKDTHDRQMAPPSRKSLFSAH